MDQPQLIGFLAGLLQSPEILPYTNLWLELTSVAIREGEPYRTVAAQISDAFLNWIKTSLKSDSASDHAASPAFILTFVEGLILLNAVGKADEAKRALGWALRGK